MAVASSEGKQGSLGIKESILAGKNYCSNPRFSGNTRYWDGPSGRDVTSMGVTLYEGNFYQVLSQYDILNGSNYMARCYIAGITGDCSMNIGTTIEGSELGGAMLQAGWNNIKFTGSTDNIITFVVPSSGELKVQEVQVNKQIDMYATGNFLNV